MNKQRYPFNDWMTPLDERKVAAFHDKIYDLACRTFGVDQDNDPAISVKIIDRTRYEGRYWFQVPYAHKAKTPDERAAVEAALLDNLAQAVDALNRYRGLQRHPDRIAAERALFAVHFYTIAQMRAHVTGAR
jgi:hypothetical protein